MVSKPISMVYALKSVVRRKQKNLFAILAIALGVSLLAGITITNDSFEGSFIVFFTIGLGNQDASITNSRVPTFNQSLADSLRILIENNATLNSEVLGLSPELLVYMTTYSDITGQIKLTVPVVGIDPHENTSLFGQLKTSTGVVNVSQLGPTEVYIGQILANDLSNPNREIKTGDTLNASLALPGNNFLLESFIVKGIVQYSGRGASESNQAIYANLNTLQTLLAVPLHFPTNQINRINLKFASNVNNDNITTAVINDIENVFRQSPAFQNTIYGGVEAFHVNPDRQIIVDSAISLTNTVSTFMTLLGYLIIFAGLLLITNIQLMNVEERESQTGIMRAIGTKKRQIITASLTEFVITGFLGSILGIFGGIIYSVFLIRAFGFAFGFDGSLIPIVMKPGTLEISFLAGFIIALLTGVLPAIRASQISIVEVLRGVDNVKDEHTDYKWVYLGVVVFVIGLMLLVMQPYAIWDMQAYRELSGATNMFLPTIFTLVGLCIMLSYFVNRELALDSTALILIIVPVFNIFFVFDWITSGSGGADYVLEIALSMIIGFVMLVGLNLNRLADLAEVTLGKIRRFSAISTLAFRQMASQRTRSTLTFAIFAVVLTLNIFMATWSYSALYGTTQEVTLLSGDSDVLIYADQPIPRNLSFMNMLNSKFSDQIAFATGFSMAPNAITYLKNYSSAAQLNTQQNVWYQNIFAVNNQSFWDTTGMRINFLLGSQRLSFYNSNYTIANYTIPGQLDPKEGFQTTNSTNIADQSYTTADANVWQALANNTFVKDKTGNLKPIIVMRPVVGAVTSQGGIPTISKIGDSVWLPTVNQGLQEFVIAAFVTSNPLNDAGLVSYGPISSTGAFVSETMATQLAAFNPSQNVNYLDSQAFFLLITHAPSINSQSNKDLSQDIEAWANQPGNQTVQTFRYQYGAYGVLAEPVYSIYALQFNSQFNFFSFIQVFISLGLLVGVLGLLVVSVRSVQERRREIGMMRSIGLKKHEIILEVILELSVMSILGLLIALIAGNMLAYGLVKINSSGTGEFLIPWDIVTLYTVITLAIAFVASIIPGRIAANIPPAEALRYVG